MSDLEQALLDYVLQPNYQPVKPRVIAKKLGLPSDQHSDLKKAVKRLAKRGKLQYGANHLVLAPRPAKEKAKGATSGFFRRTAAGFGFVRPQSAPPGDRSHDIYIPARRSGDAADGDLVAVRLKGQRRRGDKLVAAGEIVEVLQRQTHQFVGDYFERGGFGFVQVDGTGFEHCNLRRRPWRQECQPGGQSCDRDGPVPVDRPGR